VSAETRHSGDTDVFAANYSHKRITAPKLQRKC